MRLTVEQAWDFLLGNHGVSEETLTVVSNINGHTVETMTDILYAVTGYRNFEQSGDIEETDEETDDED